jgi:aryl-alcohol dehydrogenase-like predicted oxidoreductase
MVKALQGRSPASVATKIKVDGKTTQEITMAVELSLQNLKKEAIDLMQIHWPATPEETAEALHCFNELKNQGKILNIAQKTGISPLELGLRYISSQPFIDTILVGARTVEQLKEIRKSLKGPLDNELINSLNRCSDNLLTAAKGNPDMYQKISRVRYQ